MLLSSFRTFCGALLLGLVVSTAGAKDGARLQVDQWLVAGPAPLPGVAFGSANTGASLALRHEELRPTAERNLPWYPGRDLKWEARRGNPLRLNAAKKPQVALLATYVTTSRTQNVRFEVEAAGGSLGLWLDGEELTGEQTSEGQQNSVVATRLLHHGKHLLLVQTASPAAAGGTWNVKAVLQPAPHADRATLSASVDPRHSLAEFQNVVLFDNLDEPALSPDGRWLAVIHGHRNRALEKESWIEVYETEGTRLVRQFRPLKSPGNLFFFPTGGRLGFTSSEGGKTTVWSADLADGSMTPLARGIEGLVRLQCAPGGDVLYFTTDAEENEDEDAAYELWDELEDRMSDWTDQRRLYALHTTSGVRTELSGLGGFALDEFALSQEGDKLLVTRRTPRVGRPYYVTEFWLYDIPRGEARLVLSQSLPFETRPLSLTWLPGGSQLAYVTSSFESTDTNTVRSLSETDLWLLDVAAGSARNLTGDAALSVEESEGRSALLWNAERGTLWFQALIGGTVQLVETDPRADAPQFEVLKLGMPYIGEYHLSAGGLCALAGSDPVTPEAVYLYRYGDESPRLVTAPSRELLEQVELATYERWDFTNPDGYNIEGWVYYPPEYKPEQSRKWPLVVYYYGGVSPRDERFSYTYHWWAANGYILYVLNPVGAVGYGQAFADLHANDWGSLATRDIMDGVDQLLAAKPFIDCSRMACYGGSYGGFITMDLLTKTDRFAAAVSDAGISNIASYFGGGSWGFTYGDIALPGSFPWNRPDVFVDKSPVFHADRIQTPLLLIHGTADDNVPPGESEQMFTALKVLGREVSFVRFPGEDHSIATRYSNYITYREMMLEWFDKYLKNEPHGWDARWEK